MADYRYYFKAGTRLAREVWQDASPEELRVLVYLMTVENATADDIAEYAHQQISNRLPRKAEEENVQGVCYRVVKTAKCKYDDGEHYANRRG